MNHANLTEVYSFIQVQWYLSLGKKHILTADAYPSIFPNQPKYLSSYPAKRKQPLDREELDIKRKEAKVEEAKQKDVIKSLSEIVEHMKRGVCDEDWQFSSGDRLSIYLMFFRREAKNRSVYKYLARFFSVASKCKTRGS